MKRSRWGGPGPKNSLGGSLFFGDTIAGVDLVWGGGPHTNQDTTLKDITTP